MRHAFVPMSNGSDRCARCLRHLDCVPHLPIAPATMSLGSILVHRIGKTSYSRGFAGLPYEAQATTPGVSRAAR